MDNWSRIMEFYSNMTEKRAFFFIGMSIYKYRKIRQAFTVVNNK